MFALTAAIASALLFRAASATTVFAHFMVQNAYAYDVNQWETDIAAAQQIGIDGFALNWIPPDCESGLDWMPDRINDAFTAAQNNGFFLVHSFDMSYSSCNTYWNTSYMQSVISQHAGSSATYRWNSNILVTTYGGDQVQQYGNGFFQSLKDNMKNSGNAISLAPALTQYSMGAQTNPSTAASTMTSTYTSIDGFLNWQAWPLNVNQNMTISPDQALKSALNSAGRTGPYIMGRLLRKAM
jgi:glucan endo-1,3-alpha-glucosidase